MDKSQEASAPPNMNDSPPPYPEATSTYAPPPAGEYPQLPGQAPPMQSPVYVTGPPPVQQPAQQIAIVQGPIKYGKNPITITCPHCKSQVKTSIRSEPSSRAYRDFSLWVTGGWCCACIPDSTDDVMEVEHKCPKCYALLGSCLHDPNNLDGAWK